MKSTSNANIESHQNDLRHTGDDILNPWALESIIIKLFALSLTLKGDSVSIQMFEQCSQLLSLFFLNGLI